MTKKPLGKMTPKEIRAARKNASPQIREMTEALAPELLEQTGFSPAKLIGKLVSGDPEIRELLRQGISESATDMSSEELEALAKEPLPVEEVTPEEET